ncbi:MAG: hypothetical protein VX777_02535 [Chlamydiota bacterium]|nr:hypothetical protein [Chlamydiota bacterium]
MTPINVVSSSSSSTIPHDFQLNGFLGISFQIIHRIHKVWRWFQKFNTYTNPDNFLKLAAGHTLNWVAGNKVVVRIAAQAVLIAARINDHVKEQIALVKEFKEFWSVATDKYSLQTKVKWEKKGGFLSPSIRYRWKLMVKVLIHRFLRIMKAIISILKRLFVLSMKTLDATSAFSYGQDTRNEGLNELFINSSKCLESLIENKSLLLKCLKKNREGITRLLLGSSSLLSVDQMIHVIEKGIGVAEHVHRGVENASQVVGVVGRDLFKRGVFGLFQVAGLVDLMPNSWMPPVHPPWMDEKKDRAGGEHFPAEFLITRFSSWQKIYELDLQNALTKVKPVMPGLAKDPFYEAKCIDVESTFRKKYSGLL